MQQQQQQQQDRDREEDNAEEDTDKAETDNAEEDEDDDDDDDEGGESSIVSINNEHGNCEEDNLNNIGWFACNNTHMFNTMCTSLKAIMDDTTDDDYDNKILYTDTFTAFFPTDEAFEAIKDVTSSLSFEQLVDLVTFHIVDGEVILYEDLRCQDAITMTNSQDSRTKCKGKKKYQKGQGNYETDTLPLIIQNKSNYEVCNGIIHVIDQVMLPKLSYMDALIGK